MSAPARRDALAIAVAVDKILRHEGISRTSHPQTYRVLYLLVTALEGWAIQDINEVEVVLHWIRDLLEGRVVAITEETR